MAPLPSPPLSASMSRSRTSVDNMQTVAEAMLRSSLSRNPFSTSSTATTLSIGVESNSLTTQGEMPAPTVHRSSSGSSTALGSTSRTRERLRLIELERNELRRAVDEERNIVERLKREGGVPELTPIESQLRISQLKRDIEKAGNEFPQRSTPGLFKAVCSTDLLFLIDTTFSMSGHIKAAKDQVKSIVKDIGEAFLNEAEVRMGAVGYKDHGDKANIQFLDFTTSADQVRLFLNGLSATGGADLPEDVLGGIRQALNATWKHQTRCIIHIADAPPHGRTLHDLLDTEDNYSTPGSEPHHLTHRPLLEQMIKLNINYALLRINKTTDRMAFTFFQEYTAASAGCMLHKSNRYYKEACNMSTTLHSSFRDIGSFNSSASAGLLFEEQDLGTSYSALRHLVLKNVTTSASRTAVRLLASPARTSKAWAKKKRDAGLGAIDEEDDTADTTLETTPPQWNTPAWLNETLMVEGFSPDVVVHGASTLNDMMACDDNIKMNIMELTIHKRSRPFSQGAMRVVSYARTAASTNHFVVKSFKRNGKKFAHLAEDMRCQALCKAFALEFNALSGEKQPIDFTVTTCLKGRSGVTSGDECMSLEPFIEGKYIKYNNNCGYVNKDNLGGPFNRAAQAFSHFTFERSRGRFLVSDLQGVGGILTDPAIHTLDPERFKLTDTNLDKEGFKFFFATHVCNDICSRLKLKSNGAMIMLGAYDFRESWPDMEDTVCCSSKLCGRIIRLASAKKSDKFPGHHWCDTCWPQLRSSRVKWICVAPGPNHEFEVSRFFYESQGRSAPRKCAEHRDENMTVLRFEVSGSKASEFEVPSFEVPGFVALKTEVPRTVAMGSSLWARLKSARRKKSKSMDP